MTVRRRHRLAIVAGLLLALTGCTDAQEPDEPAAAPTPTPTGAEPESPVPSPSPTPVASPSPSPSPAPSVELSEEAALAAARARLAEREECDGGFADESHQVVAEVDGRMLVHVVCFVGAYQPSGELRVWDGATLTSIPVEQWQFGEALENPEVVGFVEASPEGTTITNDVKYRGLGDCGLHQRWSFDGTGLELELAREKQCSDDGEFVPPDQWPIVFES